MEDEYWPGALPSPLFPPCLMGIELLLIYNCAGQRHVTNTHIIPSPKPPKAHDLFARASPRYAFHVTCPYIASTMCV